MTPLTAPNVEFGDRLITADRHALLEAVRSVDLITILVKIALVISRAGAFLVLLTS